MPRRKARSKRAFCILSKIIQVSLRTAKSSSPVSSGSLDEALRGIDALLGAVGLTHGTRRTRPPAQQKITSPTRNSAAPKKKSVPTPAVPPTPSTPIVLRVPAWERYPWLAHGFSTRPNGASKVYAPRAHSGSGQGELNLGFTGSDTQRNVRRNREMFLHALLETKTASPKHTALAELALLRLVLLQQIHSGIVYRIEGARIEDTRIAGARIKDTPQADVALQSGDGMISTQPGLLLGILTADCLPVLVVDVRQRVVAAFHAGWRGTAARVVERGVGRMRAEFGSRPGDLTAAIGPGIGGCCYAIGDEVRNEFDSQFAYSDALFREVYDSDPIKEKYPLLFLTARAPGHSNLGPSTHLDLVEANRRQLMDAGVAQAKIHALGLCTACHLTQFFSHRAEQGFTGRMMSVVGIR